MCTTMELRSSLSTSQGVCATPFHLSLSAYGSQLKASGGCGRQALCDFQLGRVVHGGKSKYLAHGHKVSALHEEVITQTTLFGTKPRGSMGDFRLKYPLKCLSSGLHLSIWLVWCWFGSHSCVTGTVRCCVAGLALDIPSSVCTHADPHTLHTASTEVQSS